MLGSQGMSGITTQWSIGLDRSVGPDDLDNDGYVRAEVLAGWLAAAVDAYVAQCQTLQQVPPHHHIVRRPGRQPRASLLGRPSDVLVTASVTEITWTEIVVTIQVRPYGSDVDLPLSVTCRVSVEDQDTGDPAQLDAAVRDEITALERAAEYIS